MFEYDEGFIECPDCDGTGEVTTPYRRRVDCVRCDGSGQVLPPSDPDDEEAANDAATVARHIQRAALILQQGLDEGNEPYSAAVDAIANIALWCHANGINVAGVLDSAANHYRIECANVPTNQEGK